MLVTRKAGTGPCSGNSIFLPAAGDRRRDFLSEQGFRGHYWSSSVFDVPTYVWKVFFNSDGVYRGDYDNRFWGKSLRPVAE